MMARMRTGFSGVDQAGEWRRPRGFAHPELLGLGVETLPAVGSALAKRLRALGLATVGDVLQHRPRRYERAADEIPISRLFGDDEVAIAGAVAAVRLRRQGRRTVLTAMIADASGSISATWFNQPWLPDKPKPGTPVRLPGRPGRYGFAARSDGLARPP